MMERADDEISRGLKLMIDSARRNKERLIAWTEELAVEFARLFIEPKNPPAVPYSSFYLSESRTLMTDETVTVRKRYLEAGMAVRNLYSVPDDHIGIELEFVYDLTGRTIRLFEEGQREEASRLLEIRGDFTRKHMVLWVPLFVEKVIGSAGDDFYRGTSYILNASLSEP